jgi:hypothetical protein
MNAESTSDRQQQWELVVRRSFGIPDRVAGEDARKTLIGFFQDQLEENGWQSPTRGMCEPILDSLMALGASEDLDDRLLSAEMRRDAAYRLIDRGIAEVDPLHLVFDVRFEYPPQVVAVVQQVLDRIVQYITSSRSAIEPTDPKTD